MTRGPKCPAATGRFPRRRSGQYVSKVPIRPLQGHVCRDHASPLPQIENWSLVRAPVVKRSTPIAGPLACMRATSRLDLTLLPGVARAQSPRPYLMLIGFALFWDLVFSVDLKLPRFAEMPGITVGSRGSSGSDYGLPFTAEY